MNMDYKQILDNIENRTCITPDNAYGENKYNKQVKSLCDFLGDYLHKITKAITDENQVIVIEDLNVNGMMKNHHLAQAISDGSWHEFKRQLEYKCKWKGRQLVIIDRFFPSSKTCNNCGYINQELTLDVRQWTCPQCSCKLDRDLNASINILHQGLNMVQGTGIKSEGSCQQ